MFWGENVFFFQFGTSYPLYRYEIVHITIQKENGKRKAFIFAQRGWVRERGLVLLFFLFLFLGRVGTRARGWQEETKTVYKEPECKGMHISTNFVDFQSLNTTVFFNSEMSNDWQNFIGVPHTSPFLVFSKMRSLHNVCLNDIKKYSTQFWLLNMQDRLEGQ